MYYNRILRIWVINPLDYFLISALIGSLVASHLKRYLSEKAAMERLKKSIINKSGLVPSEVPILKSKEAKIKRVYRFVLENRGDNLRSLKPITNFQGKLLNWHKKLET